MVRIKVGEMVFRLDEVDYYEDMVATMGWICFHVRGFLVEVFTKIYPEQLLSQEEVEFSNYAIV